MLGNKLAQNLVAENNNHLFSWICGVALGWFVYMGLSWACLLLLRLLGLWAGLCLHGSLLLLGPTLARACSCLGSGRGMHDYCLSFYLTCLLGRNYYSHFPDEETDIQRQEVSNGVAKI